MEMSGILLVLLKCYTATFSLTSVAVSSISVQNYFRTSLRPIERMGNIKGTFVSGFSHSYRMMYHCFLFNVFINV